MNRTTVLKHEFVEYIPGDLKEGTVYVSIRFATAIHRCCCGCGNEVVTPISPTDWKLVFDGESISLYPSIGNWNFDCRSHYWIRRNRVRWAPQWSREEIVAGRSRDRQTRERYIDRGKTPPVDDKRASSERQEVGASDRSLWRKLERWLF